MKLTKLQKLAEDTSKLAGKTKVFKIFNPLTDKMDDAFINVKHTMEQLESSVLTDLLKQEGFPATESKAAKAALKVAFEAVKKAANELADLHQALGMHFEDIYHGDDLKESLDDSANTVEAAIMKAIDAAMTRDATILVFEVDGPDHVIMEIVYDFPESRNDLSKTMKAAMKGFGTVTTQKLGPARDPHLGVDIETKTKFDEKRLEAAVRKKFKGRFAR